MKEGEGEELEGKKVGSAGNVVQKDYPIPLIKRLAHCLRRSIYRRLSFNQNRALLPKRATERGT